MTFAMSHCRDRRSLPMLTLITAALLAAPLAGCATSPGADDPATGQLVLPLIQPGSHGELYHLGNATFDIAGLTNGFATTVDGSGNDAEIAVAMPPGLFTIQLHDGWTLEKSVDGGATFEPVSALLGSANPQLLRVLADQPLIVELDFVLRSTVGGLQIRLGVEPAPRELAGGFIVTTATDALADYATANASLDFAVFYQISSLQSIVLADGTKQRIYTAGAVGANGPFPPLFSPVAAEFYGDRLGPLTTIAAGFSGGFLQYTVAAAPDGSVTLSGDFQGDTAEIVFGPHTIAAVVPTLDADGFPNDEFFYDANLPFTMTGVDGAMTGTLRMRQLVP